MKDQYYIRICLYCKVNKFLNLLFLGLILLFSHNASAGKITIATQNAYNFFNATSDGKKEKVLSNKNYQLRLKRMSRHIVMTLGKPDIIALQEIENFNTLNDLKHKIQQDYNFCYQAVLLDGHKKVAINVAYLISCQLTIKNLSQLFKKQKLENSQNKLFTRPPLYINVCQQKQCIHLVNVHLRSMIGLNRIKKRRYVATKRLQQSETLALWINEFQQQWPDERLMVLGDFNALKISDSYVDVLGIIRGTPSQLNELFPSSDLVTRNLFDLSLQIPVKNRFSYRYKKKLQILDYLLISHNLISTNRAIRYTPIDYKVSDHAGLVALFDL